VRAECWRAIPGRRKFITNRAGRSLAVHLQTTRRKELSAKNSFSWDAKIFFLMHWPHQLGLAFVEIKLFE